MENYSNQDYTGKDLRSEHVAGIIEGSCFSQEKPDTHIFPEDMTGATFVNCNLDNVYMPKGNVLKDCSTRRFMAQNDGEDWLIDKDGFPTEPVNKKQFETLAISVDPVDIPEEKQKFPATIQKDLDNIKEYDECIK